MTKSHEQQRTEEIRSRVFRSEQIVELERRRRSLIAALVKIDAEIADLRGRSSPFSRIDPVDVFGGDDTDFGD